MLHFQIATPERVVYQEDIDSLSLPTPLGEITVLPHHIPLVSLVSSGILTLRKGKEEWYVAVSGGFVSVKPQSKVMLLADTAERAEELTLEAVEKAREDARKTLQQVRIVDEEKFGLAVAAMERELARVRVARKHRARGGLHISNE